MLSHELKRVFRVLAQVARWAKQLEVLWVVRATASKRHHMIDVPKRFRGSATDSALELLGCVNALDVGGSVLSEGVGSHRTPVGKIGANTHWVRLLPSRRTSSRRFSVCLAVRCVSQLQPMCVSSGPVREVRFLTEFALRLSARLRSCVDGERIKRLQGFALRAGFHACSLQP